MHAVFTLCENAAFEDALIKRFQAEKGVLEKHRFPDGETYIRIVSPVKNKTIYLLCILDHPDDKIIPLYFTARALRESGAKWIHLVSPYLPYLRHDMMFKEGEALSSRLFAKLLSSFTDSIITIDPHLHRIGSLNEIYDVPVTVLQSAPYVAQWISEHVKNPVLIGPDSESHQWVSDVAQRCNAEYIILEKKRKGDEDVELNAPDLAILKSRTPVILDDIISTGHSMMQVVKLLIKNGFPKPVCIGIHALLSPDAHKMLIAAGAAKVVSCNTVRHDSNAIYTEELIQSIK